MATEGETVQPAGGDAGSGEPSPSTGSNGAIAPCAALLRVARRLPVPTRRELEALSRKIKALDQKLAAMRQRRNSTPPTSPAAPKPPPEG